MTARELIRVLSAFDPEVRVAVVCGGGTREVARVALTPEWMDLADGAAVELHAGTPITARVREATP